MKQGSCSLETIGCYAFKMSEELPVILSDVFLDFLPSLRAIAGIYSVLALTSTSLLSILHHLRILLCIMQESLSRT